MFAVFGFDYDIMANLEEEKIIFKPFPNKSRLDKTDLLVVYEDVVKYHKQNIVLEPLTWDMVFTFNKIDILTIHAKESEDIPGNFLIKFDSITSNSIDALGYFHVPFGKSITKFYLSNPTQKRLYVDLVVLEKAGSTDKITNNLYQKTDTLLHWHIKHNLGSLPYYSFLAADGAPLDPPHTVTLYNKNEIVFQFETPYNGYVFFNEYQTQDYDAYETTWVYVHNMDKYPSVLAFDTLGRRLTNFNIVYDTNDQLTVTFTKPQAGKLIVY